MMCSKKNTVQSSTPSFHPIQQLSASKIFNQPKKSEASERENLLMSRRETRNQPFSSSSLHHFTSLIEVKTINLSWKGRSLSVWWASQWGGKWEQNLSLSFFFQVSSFSFSSSIWWKCMKFPPSKAHTFAKVIFASSSGFSLNPHAAYTHHSCGWDKGELSGKKLKRSREREAGGGGEKKATWKKVNEMRENVIQSSWRIWSDVMCAHSWVESWHNVAGRGEEGKE